MRLGQPQRQAGAVDVIVIGAGHCGLAMSHVLSLRGIEHVVLERGDVANSWRTERWDSLRLLTPNWQSRLPGLEYQSDDPDGFKLLDELLCSPPVRRASATVTARRFVRLGSMSWSISVKLWSMPSPPMGIIIPSMLGAC